MKSFFSSSDHAVHFVIVAPVDADIRLLMMNVAMLKNHKCRNAECCNNEYYTMLNYSECRNDAMIIINTAATIGWNDKWLPMLE